MTGDQPPSLNSKELNQRLDLNFALQAAGLGVWELDPLTNTVLWDDRCQALFGLVKDNHLPYEQAVRFIHPDDVDRINQAVQWALNPQSGGEYDQTYRTIGADDQLLRWVRFFGRSYFDPTGAVYRFAGLAQEVTQQVAAQLRLEESQREVFNLFEEAPVGIATLSADSQLTFQSANVFYGELVGRRPEALINKPLLEALPELVGQGFDDLLREVVATGIPFTAKEVAVDLVRTNRLETIYVDLIYQPRRAADGAVSGILVVATDVTQQVVSRRQVEASETKLRSLIAAAPAGIGLFVGRDLIIEHPNQTFIDIVGKGPGIVGLPLREAMPELLTEGQPFLRILDEVFTTGVPFISPASLVKITQNGVLNHNYYNISYTPIRNASGEIYAILDIAIDVTAQVAAQTSLASSEAHLKLLQDTVPAMLFYLDTQQRYQSYNETFMRWFGVDATAALGRTVEEFIGPLAYQVVAPYLTRAYSGQPQRFEIPAPDQLGQGRWLDIIYTPHRNEAGEVVGLIVLATDITQSKQAQTALSQGEARLRSIIEQAPMAIGQLEGREMIVELGNERIFDVWGKDASVINKPLVEALPELQGQPFIELLENVYDTGTPYYGTAVLAKLVRQGRLEDVYFDFSYSPIRAADGQINGVLILAIEVTEQVLARQEIERSEQRFRSLVEEAPFAIAVYETAELVISLANEAMINLWGKTRAVVGQRLAVALPELQDQPFIPLLNVVYATGQTYRTDEQPATLLIDGRLQTRWFNFVYHPLFDEQGQVYAILNMAVDITDKYLGRQRLQESEQNYRELAADLENRVQERTQELTWLNQDLQRSNDNLQQFAYIASHDLQEPLRKIQSFSALIQAQLTDHPDASVQSHLERISVAGERMSTLVRDLLAYSRITTRQQAFGLVSLDAILAEVLSVLDWEIQRTGARLTFEALPIVKGDRSQLGQLFQNLLTNALKFVSPGQVPTIEIEYAHRSLGELPPDVHPNSQATYYHQISVHDYGIGFDVRFLDRIFQVFQRLHSKDGFAGTGVGLAICKRVVENHGGSITANSTPGRGATFCVYLPD